jgi:hypothetical protein
MALAWSEEEQGVLRNACATLGQATVALLESRPEGPALVGSGCFVLHRGKPFLLSAAHVLKELQRKPLFFYVDVGTVRRVTGPLMTSHHEGDPESDLVDVGAVRLEGIGLPPYPAVGTSLWSSADIVSKGQASVRSTYAFIGYPATKEQLRHHPKQVKVEPQAYLCESAPHVEYSRQGVAPWSHLYLTFDKKKSRGLNGEGRVFPNPHGISGAPVFLLHDPQESPPSDRFTLAGVVTTWRPRERRLLATSGAIVLGLLDAAA